MTTIRLVMSLDMFCIENTSFRICLAQPDVLLVFLYMHFDTLHVFHFSVAFVKHFYHNKRLFDKFLHCVFKF